MNQNKRKKKKSFYSGDTLLFSILAFSLLGIGVYLTLQNKTADGVTLPDKYGRGGGIQESLSGPFVIGLGLLFALFPLSDIIKSLRKD